MLRSEKRTAALLKVATKPTKDGQYALAETKRSTATKKDENLHQYTFLHKFCNDRIKSLFLFFKTNLTFIVLSLRSAASVSFRRTFSGGLSCRRFLLVLNNASLLVILNI